MSVIFNVRSVRFFSTLQLQINEKPSFSYFIESLQNIKLEVLLYKEGQICLPNKSFSVLTQCHSLEPFLTARIYIE